MFSYQSDETSACINNSETSQETLRLEYPSTTKQKSKMGIFNFTIDNSTLQSSRPWKYVKAYWSSFELYPEWKGSTYYVFRGIAHHAREYWTGIPVVVKTFQKKHALGDDWTLYCSTADMARKLASGYNSYLDSIGCTVQVEFVKPTEVVMDSISDVMPFLQYIMRFRKRFVKSEIVVMEDLLGDGECITFVTARGQAANNGSGVLDAFAHFTYYQSGGETLVCGLQGVEQKQDGGNHVYKLTNPVVHSVSGKFGQKDRGQAGIDQFFASHVCIPGLCDGFRKPDQSSTVAPSAPILCAGTVPKALEAGYHTTPAVHTHTDMDRPPSYSPKDPYMLPPYDSWCVV